MSVPVAALSRWRPSPTRLVRLLVGLVLFGVGEALLVAAELGLTPWTVLAEGASLHLGTSIGAATVLISATLLVLWVPLKQWPGLGTLLNAVLVGACIDGTLELLPEPLPLWLRGAFVPVGILVVGAGSGLYLTSRLGPGPRDGLMTGLHRRTGWSLRSVRGCIEVAAVTGGYLLGGTVGIGTVAFALLIGPVVQLCVHALGGRDTASL